MPSNRIILPPDLSTLSHSLYARTGSGRFHTTFLETMRSNVPSSNSRLWASIFMMLAGTPASAQFCLALAIIPSE